MGSRDADGWANTTLQVPGEIRIDFAGFPFGTLVLKLELDSDLPDGKFLVTPRWEPVAQQIPLAIDKIEGSVKKGFLYSLDKIMIRPTLPSGIHKTMIIQEAVRAIDAMEEAGSHVVAEI